MPKYSVETQIHKILQTILKYSACEIDGCLRLPRLGRKVCPMHDRRIELGQVGQELQAPSKAGGKFVRAKTRGYLEEKLPGHPLATKAGRVLQHRRVYYDEYGLGPFECYWCGQTVTWGTVHIDHLNEIRDDNRLENLVAACTKCNVNRSAMLRFLTNVCLHRLAKAKKDCDMTLPQEENHKIREVS